MARSAIKFLKQGQFNTRIAGLFGCDRHTAAQCSPSPRSRRGAGACGAGCWSRRLPDQTSLAQSAQIGDHTLMLNRISVDPRVCDGKPTIRGLRITVDFVLKLLGDGYTADEIVQEYPELEKEDIYQAAKYGAWLASETTSGIA